MEIKARLQEAIAAAATKAIAAGELPEAPLPEVLLEVPPQKDLGDFSTNFAMQGAKLFKKAPRQIAEALIKHLDADFVDKVEVAGPGFINFYLNAGTITDNLRSIIARLDTFGTLPKNNLGKMQIEYVSANPTGPLHIGHGRGAAAGSAMVNICRAAGYDVQAEYYINDAGSQVDNLAKSVNHRYLELLGKAKADDFPENGYHGADIIDTAQRIIKKDGEKYLGLDEGERLAVFKELALQEKIAALKEDLAAFRVEYDRWYSERTLHPEKVEAAKDELLANGNAYEKDGAIWLNSTKYGDDKDRVIIRDNGLGTYLAADIAYHRDKYERGFSKMINLWGADHHGYVARIKAAMAGLGFDSSKLEVKLLQMVRLMRGGELVKLSKRTGDTITLAELIEEVGTDAARYFFIMRSTDSQLDFDMDLAKSQSNDNPVYYVQYAHARICSIFRSATEAGLTASTDNLQMLGNRREIDLINKLSSYEEEILLAARELAPQRIPRYLYELASLFHSFYNECRIIGESKELGEARLSLLAVVGHALRHGLGLIGVTAPEKM